MKSIKKQRAVLIQKLRATNDLQEQRKIKEEIDEVEEEMVTPDWKA
jgi:hypothetical protein